MCLSWAGNLICCKGGRVWSHPVSHKAGTAIWVSYILGQLLSYSVTLILSLAGGVPVIPNLNGCARQVSVTATLTYSGIEGVRGECIHLSKRHCTNFCFVCWNVLHLPINVCYSFIRTSLSCHLRAVMPNQTELGAVMWALAGLTHFKIVFISLTQQDGRTLSPLTHTELGCWSL